MLLRCDQSRVRNRLYTDPFLMIPGWFESPESQGFQTTPVSLKTVRYTIGYGPGFDHSVTSYYYPPYIMCKTSFDNGKVPLHPF